MSTLDTFGGMTPDEWVAFIAQLVDIGGGQNATRAPDARHDLTRKLTGTVISVNDDSIDVQLDADAPGHVTHCAPGAAASAQQRGEVLWSPGSAVWIGGSPVEASGAGAVQVPPSTPYVPVSTASLPLVGNAALKGNYVAIPGTPLVWFNIEMLFGDTTSVPTFVLPSTPAPRRQNFSGSLIKQPGTTPIPIYPYCVFDSTSTALRIDAFNGALNPAQLTQFFPGSLNAGATRLNVTGTYEALQ